MIAHAVAILKTVKSAFKWMVTRRSPHWPAARRAHLQHEPNCQWCGTLADVDVHHIQMFHERPDLELVQANMISLCMSAERCHWLRGHMGKSWLVADPDIRAKCEARRRAAS